MVLGTHLDGSVRSLGWEDSLEKWMTAHSSILVCTISWTKDPRGLESTGSRTAGHAWRFSTHTGTDLCDTEELECLFLCFLVLVIKQQQPSGYVTGHMKAIGWDLELAIVNPTTIHRWNNHKAHPYFKREKTSSTSLGKGLRKILEIIFPDYLECKVKWALGSITRQS